MSLNADQLNEALIKRRQEHQKNVAKLHQLYIQTLSVQTRVHKLESRIKGFPKKQNLEKTFDQFLQQMKIFDQYINQNKQSNQNNHVEQIQIQQKQLQKFYSNQLIQFEKEYQIVQEENETIKNQIKQMQKVEQKIDNYTNKMQQVLKIAQKQQDTSIPQSLQKNVTSTVNKVLPALIKQRQKTKERIQYLQTLFDSIKKEKSKQKQQNDAKLQRKITIQRLQKQLVILQEQQSALMQQKRKKLSQRQERQEQIQAIAQQKLQIIVPSLLQTRERYQVLISKALQFMKGKEILSSFSHLNFLFERQ